MPDTPWWASSQNPWLIEKMTTLSLQTASSLFSLPNLTKVIVMKEANQGGEYFRFFGMFKEDTARYFHIFSKWDLKVNWFSLCEGQYLTNQGQFWKVSSLQMNGFMGEFIPL